jgi:predicted AAA+ superfamily ATPase
VRMPKAYAFDTGLVAHVRGWTTLRREDQGGLWEHLVLDALRSRLPPDRIFYWRDKSGREIDFVVRRGRAVDAVECKLHADAFDNKNLQVFREHYPRGENCVVTPETKKLYSRRIGGRKVAFCGIDQLTRW